MRRILVKSLNEAFDFVMGHYYPAGCEEDAKRKDTYAVISIQEGVRTLSWTRIKQFQYCVYTPSDSNPLTTV